VCEVAWPAVSMLLITYDEDNPHDQYLRQRITCISVYFNFIPV